MKFVALAQADREGLAVEGPEGSLTGLWADDANFPGDLDTLVRQGGDAVAAAGRALAGGAPFDPATVAWLPPIRRAEKVICIGLNYVDHSAEVGRAPLPYPAIFSRWNSSLIGHGAPILQPRVSEQLDFEGELVVVLGRGGRDIAKVDALGHVAGYSVFNDASIRDYQMKTGQWTIGKNFDDTGAFGPAFVTPEDLPDGAAGLKIETRLNGRKVQSASTSDMIWDVATLIELLSAAVTLAPGDVIVSGTPAGVGMARKPPLWMKAGDVCEVEIERIGLLRNPIAAQ